MKNFKKWMRILLAVMMLCGLSACSTQNEAAEKANRMAPSAAGSNYIDQDAADNGEEASDDETYDEQEPEDGEMLSDNFETLAANFDEAYFGKYSDTQDILLGFDSQDSYGLAAIISNDGETLDWVCMGDWTQSGSSHTIDDGENPNVVNFSVDSSTDNSLRINWMGEGFLDLEDADPQIITDFFEKVDSGQFE